MGASAVCDRFLALAGRDALGRAREARLCVPPAAPGRVGLARVDVEDVHRLVALEQGRAREGGVVEVRGQYEEWPWQIRHRNSA
jgi:hypothetical protein